MTVDQLFYLSDYNLNFIHDFNLYLENNNFVFKYKKSYNNIHTYLIKIRLDNKFVRDIFNINDINDITLLELTSAIDNFEHLPIINTLNNKIIIESDYNREYFEECVELDYNQDKKLYYFNLKFFLKLFK